MLLVLSSGKKSNLVTVSLQKISMMQGNPVSCYVLQTLILYECEKHPREEEWEESCIGDRITGILLQLISCLQVARIFHLLKNQRYAPQFCSYITSRR
jgi:uncharacterized membrane protein YjjP (DUF1212 family)